MKRFGLYCALLLLTACQPGKTAGHTSPGGQMLTVQPVATIEVLRNPGKGWVLYNWPQSFPPEIMAMGVAGFHRFHWADFEPEEGRYDWHLLDEYISAWAAAGKKFAFGVMNLNTHNPHPFSTPEWVFAAGAAYRMEELSAVKWATSGVPGKKAIPVFDDPVYLRKLAAFLQALGQRYDGHPDIEFIDIRSYGNWGEGHMYPFSDKLVAPEILKKHVQLHLDAFRKTRLVLPYGVLPFDKVYDWAVAQGVSIRRDGIGGNSDGHETVRCAGKTPAVFELFGSYDFHRERGWWEGNTQNGHGYRLEDCVERGKPAYIGMREEDVAGYLADEMPLVQRLANRMGYHFTVRQVRFPARLGQQKSFPLEMEVENKGVAYLFEPCTVTFALLDGENRVIDSCPAPGLDARQWAPGAKTIGKTTLVFGKAGRGKYTLAVGLFHPATPGQPTYQLGIAGKTPDNWYPLHEVTLE